MDNIENKDEIIEEINDSENVVQEDVINDILPDKILEETKSENKDENVTSESLDIKEDNLEILNEEDNNLKNDQNESKEYEVISEPLEEKSKKNYLLIVLLSFLLIVDIIALVIYIIGLDKVLNFIK